MPSRDVEINESFVKSQIQTLCQERKGGLNHPSPPCERADYVCDLDVAQTNPEWGKVVRCIGSCCIGVDFQTDWIPAPKKGTLNDCLRSSTNIDWLLYLSQKRYRDHSSHQLFVGALGWFLLGCRLGEETQTLGQWMSQALHLSETKVAIAWWIASLLHDHAYPLAHILQVAPSSVDENRQVLLDTIWGLLGFTSARGQASTRSDVFKDLYDYALLTELRSAIDQASPAHQSRRDSIRTILTQYLVPHFFSPDELCQTPESCYDHGVLGAANVAALFDIPANHPILKAVIRAIGIHNGAACPENVDIQKDPLAFLLVLCDECQEWARHIVVGDEVKVESHNIRLRGLEIVDSNKYQIGDCLTIAFEYPDAACLSDTGWSYTSFRRSKEKAFSRLHIPEDFPIKRVEFHVWIPHEVRLSTATTL